MTRIAHLHHNGATPGRSFTNSVASLFQERRIKQEISHDDHYHYLSTSSIEGQHHQHHNHGQQQLEQQRRLEDYYAYTPDSSTSIQQQQHPWYPHAMLLLLIVLITFTVVYATYKLYQSRQIRSILSKAHCATRPLCDDDGDDMSDVYSMQQSTASHQGAAAQGGYSMASSSSEWKNTTQMEMVSPSQPSSDDNEASAV